MRRLCSIILLSLSSSPFAATVNGSLTVGTRGMAAFNSQGSFDINVTKGDAVKISELNSIAVANGSSAADRTATDNVCYYATTTQYSIDMDSENNPTGKFNLVNTANPTKKVPYELYWDDGKNGTIDATFTRNSDADRTFNSNNRNSVNCQATGGTNATITVFISNASYNGSSVGLYTDTVYITLKAK